MKCSYTHTDRGQVDSLPPLHTLLPLVKTAAAPGCGSRPAVPSLSCGSGSSSLYVDDQVALQAQKLLGAISRKSGDINTFCHAYFNRFHHTLPILNEDVFYWQMENLSVDSHFSTLLLSVFLITQLVSEPAATSARRFDVYPTLKSIYSLLQSTGKVSYELIQSGLLIASFEYCQALLQDAWLTVGTCVRMAQIMDLRSSIRTSKSEESNPSRIVEIERCIWWGIVVVER